MVLLLSQAGKTVIFNCEWLNFDKCNLQISETENFVVYLYIAQV